MKLIKYFSVGVCICATLCSTMTIHANNQEEYKIVDEIVEEIDYSSYDKDNLNVQFMNDFLDKLNVKSDFESIEDFKEYAKENYKQLNSTTIVNNLVNYNVDVVQRSTDVNVMIYNDNFYVIHHKEDLPDGILVASYIDNAIHYKETFINYELVANQATIYTIDLKHRVLPLNSISLNSSYGYRTDPINGETAYHSGMDLQASQGDPIYATESGICHIWYSEEGYGNHVEITHEDGNSTLYAHCSELLVEDGQSVSAGELIARVGSTGRSTGPHLHFEYRVNGEPTDPTDYLQGCE